MNETPSLLEALRRDVRYALRRIRSSPDFAVAVILILGLAIGANTAVFSVVDAMLLRPLPYPQPERLAQVEMTVRGSGGQGSRLYHDGRTWETIRDHAEGFRPVVYSTGAAGVNLVAGDVPAHVRQQRVGAGFFEVLGVPPILGRGFTPEEDRTEGSAVVVLSHAVWQRFFQGERGVVGESIMLRGEPHTVVGVMPADFWSPWEAQVWTPLRASTSGEGSGTNYAIMARVEPGTSWSEARARMAAIGRTLDEQVQRQDVTVGLSMVSLKEGMSRGARQPVLILWGAVAMVLLIACVNLAGLLMARSGRRTREIATHMALGGGRWAIVRQLLAESAVLAVAGGVAGIVFGAFGLEALMGIASGFLGDWRPVVLDARVLAATGALSLVTALLFGLAPALQTVRLDIQAALVESGGRGVAGRGSRWTRKALVVGQIALGVVLLVSAGLLLRTLLHLQSLNPGFDPSGVLTARASLQDARYDTTARVASLFEDSLREIEALPGVESAAVSLGLPYERLLNMPFRLVGGGDEGGGDDGFEITNLTYVTPGYLETLRIPLLRGRAIGDRDRDDSAPVVVVNRAFVREYLEEDESLGRYISIAGEEREIVGVIGDVQQRPGWGDFGPLAPMPLAYMPITQTNPGFLDLVHQWFSPAWIVRSERSVDGMAAGIREAVSAADPLLPLTRIEPLTRTRSDSLQIQRNLATIVAVLAGAALLLAAVGIHALISAAVTERTRELGIRMALGATVQQAMRTAALPGVTLAVVGVAIGGILAYAASRLLRAFVWGISPDDPLTFVGVAATILLVSAVASLLPSLRILRLDPAETLRQE